MFSPALLSILHLYLSFKPLDSVHWVPEHTRQAHEYDEKDGWMDFFPQEDNII